MSLWGERSFQVVLQQAKSKSAHEWARSWVSYAERQNLACQYRQEGTVSLDDVQVWSWSYWRDRVIEDVPETTPTMYVVNNAVGMVEGDDFGQPGWNIEFSHMWDSWENAGDDEYEHHMEWWGHIVFKYHGAPSVEEWLSGFDLEVELSL